MSVGGRAASRLALPERSLVVRSTIGAIACVLAAIIAAVAGRSPSDAVGVAAVLAFLPIVVWRYQYGVGIFIVSTFLGISGTAQKGIGGLVILVAFGQLINERAGAEISVNFFSRHKRLTLLLLAYLAWCVVGMTWAGDDGAVSYSLQRYVLNFLVFFVVYAAARNRRDLLVLAAFFVLGAAVAAADAIITAPSSSVYGGVTRVGGTFGDPNYLAAVLVIGFSTSLALMRARSLRPLGPVLAAGSAFLCLAGILFSVSRGGLIALAVAVFSAVVLAGRWRPRIAAVALLMVIGTAGYFVFVAPAATRERITSSGDGGSGRTTIWRVGWREVETHTLQGVGAGNFSSAGAKYVLEPGLINHEAVAYTAYFIDTPTVAHNTYLEVLAEEGVIGFVLFFAMVGGCLVLMRRAALRFREAGDEEMELLTYGALCGLLGFLAASFFLSEEYSKQLYLLLAMGPALLKVAGGVHGPPAVVARQLRSRRGSAARRFTVPV